LIPADYDGFRPICLLARPKDFNEKCARFQVAQGRKLQDQAPLMGGLCRQIPLAAEKQRVLY
jgi:hypothetical protein